MSGQNGGLNFCDLNLLQHRNQEDNTALLQQVSKRRCSHAVPRSVYRLLRVPQLNVRPVLYENGDPQEW